MCCSFCGERVGKLVEVPLDAFTTEANDTQPCQNPRCGAERSKRVFCGTAKQFVGPLCHECQGADDRCCRCYAKPCEDRLVVIM